MSASDGVQVYSRFTWSYTSGGQGIAPAVASGTDILVPFDNTNGSSTAIALVNPGTAAPAILMAPISVVPQFIAISTSLTPLCGLNQYSAISRPHSALPGVAQ